MKKMTQGTSQEQNALLGLPSYKYNNPEEYKKELLKMAEMMEEFANTSKEEMGKRTPGERCAYENV